MKDVIIGKAQDPFLFVLANTLAFKTIIGLRLSWFVVHPPTCFHPVFSMQKRENNLWVTYESICLNILESLGVVFSVFCFSDAQLPTRPNPMDPLAPYLYIGLFMCRRHCRAQFGQ